MQLNLVFGNIYQGLIYAGQSHKGEHMFTGWHPARHLETLKALKPDVCGLAEMPLTQGTDDCPLVRHFAETLGLPYYRVLRTEASWLVEKLDFGLVVFSRYPITDYKTVPLPNPKLETIRPNGEHWVMHDKDAQQLQLDIDGRNVQVTNLHGFPFHLFGRRIDEAEFAPFREAMVTLLTPPAGASIAMGDFNNRDLRLENVFVDAFASGRLTSAVPVSDDNVQIDHILLSPDFRVINTCVETGFADHPLLKATVYISI